MICNCGNNEKMKIRIVRLLMRWLLQTAGPAPGVAGHGGKAAGPGLGAERGAEHRPAGQDPPGGRPQHPEGDQPEPGPLQRPSHQPVPGTTGYHRHTPGGHTCTRTHAHTGTHMLERQLWTIGSQPKIWYLGNPLISVLRSETICLFVVKPNK